MVAEPIGGYILRISKEEWLRQVFDRKKYYPGLIRRWSPGMTILLARKAVKADSFIGYGVIERVQKPAEAAEDEQEYCRDNGWKQIIIFNELVQFEEPVPIKETFLRNDKRKGKYLHAALLTVEQVSSVLKMANNRASHHGETVSYG